MKFGITVVAVLLSFTFTFVPTVNATAPSSSSEVFRLYALDLNSVFLGQTDSEVVDEEYEVYWCKYVIPIVVAVDEEFQQISYWVPWNINGLGWKDAVVNIIERADNFIYKRYGINFKIVGFTTWDSEDNPRWEPGKEIDEIRLEELANELNWNPEIKGKTILAGFTGQPLRAHGRDVWGVAFNPAENSTKALLVTPSGYYWADDNVFHHEISHLLGIPYECEEDDCVMSYKEVYIDFWIEDSWLFYIGGNVTWAFVSHNYCPECEAIVLEGVKPYVNFMLGRRCSGYGARCVMPVGVFPK